MGGKFRNWSGFISVYIILCLLLLSACSPDQEEADSERPQTIEWQSDLAIGLPDQSIDHQLARPLAVRTDSEGNIYIADQGSLEIKVFDRDGAYLRSIGGRGRGPGEFLSMELVELTPEEHFVVMDRGNLKYITITKEGEFVESHPYNMSDQFYPQAIRYLVNENLLALFFNTSSREETPIEDRDLFHIASRDFQERKESFFPIKQVDTKNRLLHGFMQWHPGSFLLLDGEEKLVFTPSTYLGKFFVYQNRNGQWEFDGAFRGIEPNIEPFEVFDSFTRYQRALENRIARATRISHGGEAFMGRQLSMDGGLFQLDGDRLIHFYLEWREGYERAEESDRHPLDLYTQVFDLQGNVLLHDFLFTITDKERSIKKPLVNWMDREGDFYLIEYPEDIPVVRRFSLELPE